MVLDWMNLINESLEYKNSVENLIVDFGDYEFVATEDFVVLACLIEEFYQNGCKISFVGGTRTLNKYLENIRFKLYWEKGYERDVYTNLKIGEVIPLWKISNSMIDSYANYTNDFFRREFLKKKDLIPLSANLKEVLNNIFDHAGSENTGYVLTQYYPQNDILSFSICDFGIGIPSSVNDFRKKQGKASITDQQAIIKAISLGFSAQSTIQNRGMGLNNLSESIKALDGTLAIISNNAFYNMNQGKIIVRDNNLINFKGTLIACDIPINNLDDFDESDSIYSF